MKAERDSISVNTIPPVLVGSQPLALTSSTSYFGWRFRIAQTLRFERLQTPKGGRDVPSVATRYPCYRARPRKCQVQDTLDGSERRALRHLQVGGKRLPAPIQYPRPPPVSRLYCLLGKPRETTDPQRVRVAFIKHICPHYVGTDS